MRSSGRSRDPSVSVTFLAQNMASEDRSHECHAIEMLLGGRSALYLRASSTSLSLSPKIGSAVTNRILCALA